MRNKINIPDREWSRNFWLRVKALFGNCITTETDPTVPSWAKQPTKPTYTANEVGAIPTTQKGAASGVAELDSGGKVPSSQLPSYVDDVLEFASQSAFPATGEAGKIYVALDTNLTYRWSGSAYVEISPSLALGETSSTAYRGDRGKTAYDHAQAKGSAFASGLYKIATNGEGHVIGATAVQKSDIMALGLTAEDIGAAGNPVILSNVDMTEADNGVNAYTSKQISFVDSNGYMIVGLEAGANNNGKTTVRIHLGNYYDGSTRRIWSFQASYGKDGSIEYLFSSPRAFRAGLSAKAIQSAVADPVASGTALEFISGITQNDQGVILPIKKTVATMAGASAVTAGSSGLVPAPSAGDQDKFLRADGTWANTGAGTDVGFYIDAQGYLCQRISTDA